MNEWQCRRFVRRGKQTGSLESKLTRANGSAPPALKTLNGSLRGKKICVLGYAFKRDTSDTRESQAAEVIRLLLQEAPVEISIFDPMCDKSVIESELASAALCTSTSVTVHDSPYEACVDAAAVMVLTEWRQFSYPPVPVPEEVGMEDQHGDFRIPGRLRAEPPCEDGCTSCALAEQSARKMRTHALDWVKVASAMSTPRWVFDGRGMVDPGELQKLGFHVAAVGKPGFQLQAHLGSHHC